MPHQSRSVSFARNTPNRNTRNNRSPPQRINVNIMTPGCVVSPTPLRSRTPTPHRPFSPPPYSPPYFPYSTPSPSVSRTTTPSHPSASSTPDANASAESVVENTPCGTLEYGSLRGRVWVLREWGLLLLSMTMLPEQNLELHRGAVTKLPWNGWALAERFSVSSPKSLWILAKPS